MNDRAFADLHPDLQPLAQAFEDQCKSAGINAFIDQTYRGEAEQNADYAQGRTIPGKVITNAKFGESPHNITLKDGTPAACAFDFAIYGEDGKLDWNDEDPLWQKAISIGESLGLISGSTFSHLVDEPHMELPNWRNYIPG